MVGLSNLRIIEHSDYRYRTASRACFCDTVFTHRQIEALVEDKYMNHMKMTELEQQRSRLCCEVECLKAAAKSSTQTEQQWKGDVVIIHSLFCD